MGVWSKLKEKVTNIKNIIRGNNVPMLGEGKGDKYNESQQQSQYKDNEYLNSRVIIESPNRDGSKIAINSIKFDRPIQYSNVTTNLMVAKVNFIEDFGEYGGFKGKEDYVAFELPEGMVPTQEVILQKIANYYAYERNMPNNAECKYLGYINQDPYNYEIHKSPSVNEYVNNRVSEEIREIKQDEDKRRQKSYQQLHENANKESKNYREKLQQDTLRKLQEQNQERENRINNFYLEQKNVSMGQDGKVYTAYDGIDINNGDILKIRELNKVGKDKNTGDYLYTTYIECASDKNYAQNLKFEHTEKSIPVCFTSKKRIEDIVNEQNPSEIYSVLSLLSDQDMAINNNGYLNFIGAIDENFNISKDQGRLSLDIQKGIADLQYEFYQRKMSQQSIEKQQGEGGVR